MTSQNEESKENDPPWLDFYKSLCSETQEAAEAEARLREEYNHIVTLLPKAKGKRYKDLAFKKRFIATQLWIDSEAKITKHLVHSLALRIAMLDQEIRRKPTPDLEKQLEKVKKDFDDHLAKRIAQLFSASEATGIV